MPMPQDDGELDSLVRKRIRALRVAPGWTLDELAGLARCGRAFLRDQQAERPSSCAFGKRRRHPPMILLAWSA
jgi:hypothetical protein